MKRKILTVIYVILIVIMLKLIYNTIANNILISKYNNGEYSEDNAKALTHFNFIESYIANYNYGNILYQKGEYDEAVKKYKQALEGIIPEKQECKIRINCALAICKTVSLDENDQNSIKEAIETYENAIEILTQEGCASKNNNMGHSQKAEQLRKDIQNEINRLKKLKQNDSDEDDEEQEDSNNNEKNETIEEKIQNIKENAIKDQREVEDKYKNYNKEYNKKDKNW